MLLNQRTKGVTIRSAVPFHGLDAPADPYSVFTKASAAAPSEGGTTGTFGLMPRMRPVPDRKFIIAARAAAWFVASNVALLPKANCHSP